MNARPSPKGLGRFFLLHLSPAASSITTGPLGGRLPPIRGASMSIDRPRVLSVRASPAPAFAQVARVSVSSAGVEANGPSGPPSISGNGRFVVFASAATNLVAGDTNALVDIFLRDRDTDADGDLRRARRRCHDPRQPRPELGAARRGQQRSRDLRRRPLRGVRLHGVQPGRRRERSAAGLPRRPHDGGHRPGQRKRLGRCRRCRFRGARHQRRRRRRGVPVAGDQSRDGCAAVPCRVYS